MNALRDVAGRRCRNRHAGKGRSRRCLLPAVQTLQRESTRIVHTADVKERLLATGHRIIAGTPQELADKVRREIDKTRKIMAESGMAAAVTGVSGGRHGVDSRRSQRL